MDSRPYGRLWHDSKDSAFCITLLLQQVTCDYSKSSIQQWYITHIELNYEEKTPKNGELII